VLKAERLFWSEVAPAVLADRAARRAGGGRRSAGSRRAMEVANAIADGFLVRPVRRCSPPAVALAVADRRAAPAWR